ncbi:NB-ARC domain-containing protein [Glycomyces paridis]|uniref:NB-ARC domain-containing protein n=1 Tax=Glycomyces paridis TaxID=2126555 RepID=UPI0013050C7E|nr:NB-ARC domain-containing protein [Glycomyces paridis]
MQEAAASLEKAVEAAPPATRFDSRIDRPSGPMFQGGRIDIEHLHFDGSAVASPRPQRPASEPLLIGSVPRLAADRQYRAADKRLATAVDEGGTAIVRQVISGMGGVGKTQIAAAYAQSLWDRREVDLLVWVNAARRDAIITDFARANSKVNHTESDDPTEAANTFITWLAHPDSPRWLLVLDDLTDPADLEGLWPPTTPRGRTIITTRRRDAALDTYGGIRINVDLFTPEEALNYLQNRLAGDRSLLVEAEALARDLGNLPLALAQAAAYILDQPGMTRARYRELLTDRTVALAELSPEVFPDGYQRAVAATWSLSIELADRAHPGQTSESGTSVYPRGLARALLQIASLTDPASSPANLFTTQPVRDFVSVFGQRRQDPETTRSSVSKREVLAAIGRLHRLHLLDFDGNVIRIHGAGADPSAIDRFLTTKSREPDGV